MVLPQLGWDFPPESTWSRGSLANRHRGCLGDSRASQVDNQYSSQSREEVGMRQKKRWADATVSDKMKKDSLNSSGQSGQHSALRSWHLSWHLAGIASHMKSHRESHVRTQNSSSKGSGEGTNLTCLKIQLSSSAPFLGHWGLPSVLVLTSGPHSSATP